MSRFRPVQDYYPRFQAILNLYVTNVCNLRCRHCGTGSGPDQRGRLRLDDAILKQIDSAITAGPVRALHVSGGEPFLCRDELAALSALAVTRQIPLAINTNGYWAGSVERGQTLLDSLPGITQLILSTDIYHAEWLPPATLINAAAAGVASGRLVDIAVVTPFGAADAYTNAIDDALATTGLSGRVRRFNAALGPGARPIALDDADLSPWRPDATDLPCGLLNRPTMLEDGSLLACCNTPKAGPCKGSPLVEPATTGLDDALASQARDPILQALRTIGPTGLAALLGDQAATVRRPRYREGDICTLCTDMMSRPDLVTALRDRLAGPDGRVARAAAAFLVAT